MAKRADRDSDEPPASGSRRDTASTLAERTARNSLFGLVGLLYPTVLALVVTPILVHHLGVREYGVLALATLIISFLSLLDFGLAPSLVKRLSDALGRGDHHGAQTVVDTGMFLYLALGGIVAGLGIAASLSFLPAAVGVPRTLGDAARPAFAIASAGLFFAMVMAVFASVPLAAQRIGVVARTRMVASTITAVGTSVVAYTVASVEIVILITAFEPITTITLYWFANRRIVPGFRFRPRWNGAIASELLRFGGLAAIGGLSGFILLYLDRILLGSLAGVAAVAYYTVPSTLAQRLHAGATSLAGIVFPASSALFARGDIRRAQTLYARAAFFVTLAVATIAIPAACLAPEILSQWIDPTFAAKSGTAMRLLVATFFVLSLNVVPYYVLIGAGRPGLTAATTLASAAMNITLLVLLVPKYGIVGAATAFLISVTPILVLIPLAERRVLCLTGTVWGSIGRRLGIPAILQCGVSLALAPLITSLAMLVAALAASVMVLPITAWLLRGLRPDDIALLRRLAARS